MAAPKTLGKTRVLGTPKPSPPVIPDHLRNNTLLSPSASSLSLNSQVSTSKSSNEDTDISTAVAQHFKDDASTPPAVPRLVCPICEEDMVTLLQLNRHLDDTHKHLEVVEQDEVKTWFKTQVVKAKKFQPLAVLNQKLKSLDIFEFDDEQRLLNATTTLAIPATKRTSSTPSPPLKSTNPDEAVSRTHWQRATQNGACSDPMCGKRLGATNGNMNCRHCGKLFCNDHTMYQMKLSPTARHDPAGGYWCRVCETCYISREGYIDYTGVDRDHTSMFATMRRSAVDKAYMDVSRLEKRLTKLTNLLTNSRPAQEQTTVDYLWSFTSARSSQRIIEQSIVDWQDDAGVSNCPFCQQDFSNYGLRRHHCRLCGRVVCGDPQTSCSTEIALDVNKAESSATVRLAQATVLLVRMCKDCSSTLFRRSDFAREVAVVPPDQRAFQLLKQFETGIGSLMPRFQKLLIALQHPDQPPSTSQLADAAKVRKRLTDAFSQYATAARRIKDLPTTSSMSTQARLQTSVYNHASRYLHVHMLPLKSLPKLLRRAESLPSPLSAKPLGAPNQAEMKPHGQDDVPLRAELETKESSLRSRQVVLQEQQFLVGEMLADARRRRRFEEADALSRNVEEISGEITRVEDELSDLAEGFARMYSEKSSSKG